MVEAPSEIPPAESSASDVELYTWSLTSRRVVWLKFDCECCGGYRCLSLKKSTLQERREEERWRVCSCCIGVRIGSHELA